MPSPRLRRNLLLLLAGILLAACAALSQRADQLVSAQRAYEGALRWGHFDVVYALHDAGAAPAALSGYKVTAYNVLSGGVEKDQMRAEQTVEIRYYHVDYMQEHTLTDRQRWIYDTERKRWSLSSPPPAFANDGRGADHE